MRRWLRSTKSNFRINIQKMISIEHWKWWCKWNRSTCKCWKQYFCSCPFFKAQSVQNDCNPNGWLMHDVLCAMCIWLSLYIVFVCVSVCVCELCVFKLCVNCALCTNCNKIKFYYFSSAPAVPYIATNYSINIFTKTTLCHLKTHK